MSDFDRELSEAARALPATGPSLEVLAGVAARAQEEDLLDVAYTQVDSPLGPLPGAAPRPGLVRVASPARRLDPVLARLAEVVSPRILEAPARLDPIRREL